MESIATILSNIQSNRQQPSSNFRMHKDISATKRTSNSRLAWQTAHIQITECRSRNPENLIKLQFFAFLFSLPPWHVLLRNGGEFLSHPGSVIHSRNHVPRMEYSFEHMRLVPKENMRHVPVAPESQSQLPSALESSWNSRVSESCCFRFRSVAVVISGV
jgi:hypothetical protein